jgi:anti-sigma factor RsiW
MKHLSSSPAPLAAVERRTSSVEPSSPTWWRRRAFPWLLLLGIALRGVALIAMICVDMMMDMM